MTRAQFIMQRDYHRDLHIEEIAGRLGLSRATLFRQFQTETGSSPKEFLDKLRFQKARELLMQSASTVQEIAFACGFNCPHYFSRAFRRRYGLPPSAIRK